MAENESPSRRWEEEKEQIQRQYENNPDTKQFTALANASVRNIAQEKADAIRKANEAEQDD